MTWVLIKCGSRGHVYWSSGAYNLMSPYENAFAIAAKVAVVGVMALSAVVAWRTARGARSSGPLWLACLGGAIAVSPVFSPQFLLILLPLAFAVRLEVQGELKIWWLLGVCSILTTLIYPFQEESLTLLLTRTEIPLLLRNVIFTWISLSLFVSFIRRNRGEATREARLGHHPHGESTRHPGSSPV